MSRWKPCKRNDFISRLRKLGFAGLYSGAKHQFMVYEIIASRFPRTKNILRLNLR
jgi:hypothetical protein